MQSCFICDWCALHDTPYQFCCPNLEWFERGKKDYSSLFYSMYNYFVHNPKHHLKVSKLVKSLKYKGNKLLKNIKTQWISMLSPSKSVLNEYKTLVVKRLA